jgi:hypothetical protein
MQDKTTEQRREAALSILRSTSTDELRMIVEEKAFFGVDAQELARQVLKERALNDYRSFPTERLREVASFDLELTAEAELAQTVLDEREAECTAKKTWQDHVRDHQQDPTAHLGMLRESNLRMLAAEGFYRLDDETLETVQLALAEKVIRIARQSRNYSLLNSHPYGSRWTSSLWAIDRACRALGIE